MNDTPDVAECGTTRGKRITQVKAARLVAAMEAIRECRDMTPELSRAFDDARQAISRWYDGENGP